MAVTAFEHREAERTVRDEPTFMTGFEDLAVGAGVYDDEHEVSTLRQFQG